MEATNVCMLSSDVLGPFGIQHHLHDIEEKTVSSLSALYEHKR
jgi:hypothetical protein